MTTTLRHVDVAKSPCTDAREIEKVLQAIEGQPTVYFVGFREFVKIGYSINLGARLYQLNSLPEPLAILHFEAGTMREEREYHKRFAQLRTYGEWFYHLGSLADFLKDKPLTKALRRRAVR